MSYQELLVKAQALRELIAKIDEQIEQCEQHPCSASYWAGLCADRDSLEEDLDIVESEIERIVGD